MVIFRWGSWVIWGIVFFVTGWSWQWNLAAKEGKVETQNEESLRKVKDVKKSECQEERLYQFLKAEEVDLLLKYQ